MRRFCVFLSALLIIATLVISTAKIFGGKQSPSASIIALHLNECDMPCWMGLVPGTTKADEAWAKISEIFAPSYHIEVVQEMTTANPPFVTTTLLKLSNAESKTAWHILLKSTEGLLTMIYINLLELKNAPTFGELLNHVGRPVCIYPDPKLTLILEADATGALSTEMTLTRWEWAAPVWYMGFHSHANLPPSDCSIEGSQPWKGLTSR